MVAWISSRPTRRAGFATVVALLIALCAGGVGDAAMALTDESDSKNCGAADASAHEHCRAANPETPSLAPSRLT